MASQLKHFFDSKLIGGIALDFKRAHAAFDATSFVKDCQRGLDELELLARGWHIAEALRRHLPSDFAAASQILLRSLGPAAESSGMASFRFLPHTCFVSKYGIDDFENSMRLQYELTQRFSAEFSIRTFIEKYPEQTYARLKLWAKDPSVHVRRLVSEGTRPRLPWAARLRAYQKDPRPVIALLEMLKDDPELYVRRSVANSLNDIAKDHPEIAVEVCRRWSADASPQRQWIVRHALRSLVKQGHSGALDLLGVGSKPKVQVSPARFTPKTASIGGKVAFEFQVTSTSAKSQTLQIDYRVHFVKASGKTAAKVFKLRRVDLPARSSLTLAGRVSFAPMTTRKPYPGLHTFEALINGVTFPLGSVRVK
ncbi:MAG: DNA alkylation repair protein [Acidobacteriota bacterium]